VGGGTARNTLSVRNPTSKYFRNFLSVAGNIHCKQKTSGETDIFRVATFVLVNLPAEIERKLKWKGFYAGVG